MILSVNSFDTVKLLSRPCPGNRRPISCSAISGFRSGLPYMLRRGGGPQSGRVCAGRRAEQVETPFGARFGQAPRRTEAGSSAHQGLSDHAIHRSARSVGDSISLSEHGYATISVGG